MGMKEWALGGTIKLKVRQLIKNKPLGYPSSIFDKRPCPLKTRIHTMLGILVWCYIKTSKTPIPSSKISHKVWHIRISFREQQPAKGTSWKIVFFFFCLKVSSLIYFKNINWKPRVVYFQCKLLTWKQTVVLLQGIGNKMKG